MSDKRIVIETPCEHGDLRDHCTNYADHFHGAGCHRCPGGSRRALDPITVIAAFNQVVTVQDILDALGEI